MQFLPRIKSTKPLIFVGLIAGLTCVTGHAENYGLNFLGTTTDNVTGTAGVVPIGGYNNISLGATLHSITSSNGLSTATLAVSGPGAANGYRTVGTPPNTGGDASLMDGYFDAGGNGGQAATGTGATSVTFTFTLLTSAAYNIYIYDPGDNGRPGNIGDGLPDYSFNGTDYYTSNTGGAFTGYVQGQTQSTELSSYPSTLTPGNYILISGVAAPGGTITIVANSDNRTFRSPIDGIELIGVPEPSALALGSFGLVGALVVTGLRRRRADVAQ